MSFEFYKILHVVGVMLLFTALGGVTLHALSGGDKGRKLLAASHGVALLLLLVAGFGMIAKLKLAAPYPGWIWGKLVIWLLLGGAVVLPRKKPELAKPLFLALPLLGGVAAWLAIMKPF